MNSLSRLVPDTSGLYRYLYQPLPVVPPALTSPLAPRQLHNERSIPHRPLTHTMPQKSPGSPCPKLCSPPAPRTMVITPLSATHLPTFLSVAPRSTPPQVLPPAQGLHSPPFLSSVFILVPPSPTPSKQEPSLWVPGPWPLGCTLRPHTCPLICLPHPSRAIVPNLRCGQVTPVPKTPRDQDPGAAPQGLCASPWPVSPDSSPTIPLAVCSPHMGHILPPRV